MKIFVSNLGLSVQDADLSKLFTEFGEVTSSIVITDRLTGRSRCFGFVEMSNDAAGQKAIEILDRKMIEGRSMRVTLATPGTGKNNFLSNPW